MNDRQRHWHVLVVGRIVSAPQAHQHSVNIARSCPVSARLAWGWRRCAVVPFIDVVEGPAPSSSSLGRFVISLYWYAALFRDIVVTYR